jgi:hypothetical protein
MASLSKVGRRFEVPFTIIEGGSGVIRGVMSEADQKQIPVYAFVNPRHVLRTPLKTALRTGMVVRSQSGAVFIVGENGPSEQPEGTIWMSWRLFDATQQVHWTRRRKTIDPVTRLERDQGFDDLGLIWAAIEPLDREVSDFRMSASFEQARIITGQPIKHDDLIDERKVTRSERALGVTIGVLT